MYNLYNNINGKLDQLMKYINYIIDIKYSLELYFQPNKKQTKQSFIKN